MKFVKTSLLILVVWFSLSACSDLEPAPQRAGLGDGPTPAVSANGGPYLYYFSNLNRDPTDNRLSEGELNMLSSVDTTYNVTQSIAPLIKRESVVMSYLGVPNLANLSSTNLKPAEMFYSDSGFFYRTDVSIAGTLRQQQISSLSTLDTVCDQLNEAFLDNINTATFLLELPGPDNDCTIRSDNIIVRITEDDLISVAPLDVTANLTINSNLTQLKDISRVMSFSGNSILKGFLVVNGMSVRRVDTNFNLIQSITHNAVTSVELGSGGTGLAVGLNNYLVIDGNVRKYNDKTRTVEAAVLYSPSPSTATIDATVCKLEECLFVTNNAGSLDLYVIAEDSTKPAQLLRANIQNAVSPNGFDAVQTMVRNADKITFTARNTSTTAGQETGLYQIDISALASKLELHLETNFGSAPLTNLDMATTIDLFLTSGLVYYNKDYDRIHDLTATSKAVVMTPDLRPDYVLPPGQTENDRTIYATSAWVGVVDTIVSRSQVVEMIILAETIDKDPPNLVRQTELKSYFTSNHGLASTSPLVPVDDPDVEVVHMSFQLVGNVGVGDAFIAKASSLLPIDLADPALLQTDVYFINALSGGSLTRITATDLLDESAFTSCANAGNLVCR